MRNDRNTGQKTALVALVFIGILTLGLGFYKVRSQIVGPFEAQISRAEKNQFEEFFSEQQPQEDLEAQKTRDTDGDSISDYDELNTYKTSPYLKDTDSDSYDDKMEIGSGNDPNCASGKVCLTSVAGKTEGGTSGSSVSALEQDLAQLEKLTPVQVRTLLKEKGFTEGDLQDVDDTTLLNVYRESLQKALEIEKQKTSSPQRPAQLPGVTAPVEQSQQFTIQEILKLSKPELLGMLAQTGELSEGQIGELQKLEEQQLKEIVLQALQKAQLNTASKSQ